MESRKMTEARNIQALVNNMTEKEVRERLTAILYGHRNAYVNISTARKLIGGSVSYLRKLVGNAMIKNNESSRNNLSAIDCLLNASII